MVAGCSALSLLAACATGDDGTVVGRAGSTGQLTIGISSSKPGVGFQRLDGTYRGFDIDVARYVANELGVEESGITWKEATAGNRENLITSGQVDMVVSSYSITAKRKEVVDFVGPYFVAGQDLMVRLLDTRITGPESLNTGLRLCSSTGSTSAQYVKAQFAQNTSLVEYPRSSDCVTALLADLVDALTTDDIILAGYAAQNPELLRVVGKPFSKEEYGIGLRRGDSTSKTKITAAVQKMMDTGEWRRSLDRNVGSSEYVLPDEPTLVP